MGSCILCHYCSGRRRWAGAYLACISNGTSSGFGCRRRRQQRLCPHGIHAGPNIWLFQRVQAPLLHKNPGIIVEKWGSLDVSALGEITSTATWVHFGRLLRAYGVQYATGDKLEIYGRRTSLPVHKLWILVVGLVGRYGKRRDMGQFGSRNHIRRTSGHFSAHDMYTPPFRAHFEELESAQTGRDDTFAHTPRLEVSDSKMNDFLFGITGQFQLHLGKGEGSASMLEFQPASQTQLGQPNPDRLSLKSILMLALGYMQLEVGGLLCSAWGKR